jgi:hypothetical protein
MARNEGKWHVPNTVQVAICITRSVVVDDDIDSLDIDATAEDVSGDKDTLLEVLELRVTGDTTTMLDGAAG